MLSAKVIGTATSTVKHPALHGHKLLVVQPLQRDELTPDGDPFVAIDLIGAGRGETVILSSDGQHTRQVMRSETSPVRWTVLGVTDS